ncbi:MAG: hypothetical protein JW776_12400 [Candidatus Lokiarchaeota archaeon]|nr:hypothetical protein [Candidatus Lokiarchaeota archaeon]
MNNKTLAYLVGEQGTLVQLKPTIILQNFKSYNVILFYTPSKNLYNWIGRKANSQIVESIEKAEQLILNMHPDMTVLRHITVKEQDKDSLDEFLDDIGISLFDYKERVRLWWEFEISVYADIQKLKIKENNHLMLNQLEKVIDVANNIINLAEKIHDSSLVEEKRSFIEEITKKLHTFNKKNATLLEIDKMITALRNCIQIQDIEEAVTLYNRISLLYKRINENPIDDHQRVIDDYLHFYDKWEKSLPP